MKSEYATWRDEIEAPKLTIAERVAAWFDRPQPTPPKSAEPEMFIWKSVADLFEGQSS